MTGFRAFLGKELREIVRTWRIWVLPGLMLFFAITSPIAALVTPSLLESFASSQPGVVIKLPDPTALDAYRQFLKTLDQLFLLALIVTSAGAVAAERRSGTAVLVLTKPVSRRGFITAKIAAQQLLLVVTAIIGAFLCLALTTALFPSSMEPRFLVAVVVWLAYALLVIVVMALFSAVLPTQGAAGAGLAFYFLSLLLGLWPAANRFTFIGLTSAGQRILAGAEVALAWPLVTAGLAAVGFGLLAAWQFERAEL